jgi:hypothetical protein
MSADGLPFSDAEQLDCVGVMPWHYLLGKIHLVVHNVDWAEAARRQLSERLVLRSAARTTCRYAARVHGFGARTVVLLAHSMCVPWLQ